MKKLLYIQVSSKLINGPYQDTKASRYYEDIYRLKKGYQKGTHFWEIPLWIAEIDGFLDGYINTDFLVLENSEPITNINHYDYILFSVMDVNKSFIEKFVREYTGKAKILTGGYIQIPGLKYFDNPEALAEYLGVPYKYALNYRHFENTTTIPRITLSTGCKHKCKFCTTQHWIQEKTREEILYQATRISTSLRFQYVYVADSTFGQAPNYNILKEAYDIVRTNNPEFEGFIIQTTAAQLNKPGFIEELQDLGVRIVEMGVESFNDRILKALHKPASEKLIRTAVIKLHNQGLKVILNVIIGIVEEDIVTYIHTLDFINESKSKLYALNIYNLAIYKESEYGEEMGVISPEDSNELSLEKSFGRKVPTQYFYNRIFDLATEILERV